ncbi:b4094d49-54ac-4d65-89ed-9308b73e4ff9 [Sclerotinia trifoliorum]|uniref:B4094d49-54ac-4d65-89ed-9308b73e4ff9 n=1 Tax=Sclerotinia trifoliorum TaxID=28548 RepID=A0A8H2ZTY1_9HELO|nr:b4094d49-54ac-4d65-89ed-9308b73e4ff9 [Sclerotinia trifoliorum]
MAMLTADNRGPGLNVGMWIILIPTVMMVAAKMYTKWYSMKKISPDDILISIALLTAIAQSVAVTEEVRFGLGRRAGTLSDVDMNKFLVAQYISNIFYVISIYTSKISTAYFFVSFCRSDAAKRVVSCFIWLMAIWTLTSVVSLLAQCHLPRPWNSFDETCINLKVFWIFGATVDVLTQVIISFLPIFLLSGLHMSNKSSKWLVMALFVPNLLVIPISIFRLIFLLHAINSSDYTWSAFIFGILTSFQPFISIMIACIPFVKPILDSLILQPYLIAVEEPQSVIPGNSKGTSWVQRIQESRAARSQRPPGGSSKSLGGRKNSDMNWPYTQTQDGDEENGMSGEEFEMRSEQR